MPRRMRARSPSLGAACAALVVGAAACGGSSPAPSGTTSYPVGAWTWVDVAETACSDGSSTGFAVNPGDDPDLVFFMDGGGACWDFQTCFIAASASAGPVRAPQFQARSAEFAGTFLDRTDPANPFRRWTFVFVPYCTGDLHAGDRVATYSGGLFAPKTWYHKGRVNVAADLARIVPAFPHVRRLVVGGASAGGYGSMLLYDSIRAAWSATTTSLIDDSGQPLEGDALAPALRTAWLAAWNLQPLLDQVCPGCASDFSQIVPLLAARYPSDRLALLSSLQDATMRGYFQLSPDVFQADVLQLVTDRYAPLADAGTFVVAGQDHALLRDPSSYAAGGVSLTDWLVQLVSGDPAWHSVGP